MRVFIVLFFLFGYVMANSFQIDSFIEEIKNSYGDERRVKMNKLKILLRRANLEKRAQMIAKIRKRLAPKNLSKINTNHNKPNFAKKTNNTQNLTTINSKSNHKVSNLVSPKIDISKTSHNTNIVVSKTKNPIKQITKTTHIKNVTQKTKNSIKQITKITHTKNVTQKIKNSITKGLKNSKHFFKNRFNKGYR